MATDITSHGHKGKKNMATEATNHGKEITNHEELRGRLQDSVTRIQQHSLSSGMLCASQCGMLHYAP